MSSGFAQEQRFELVRMGSQPGRRRLDLLGFTPRHLDDPRRPRVETVRLLPELADESAEVAGRGLHGRGSYHMVGA